MSRFPKPPFFSSGYALSGGGTATSRLFFLGFSFQNSRKFIKASLLNLLQWNEINFVFFLLLPTSSHLFLVFSVGELG